MLSTWTCLAFPLQILIISSSADLPSLYWISYFSSWFYWQFRFFNTWTLSLSCRLEYNLVIEKKGWVYICRNGLTTDSKKISFAEMMTDDVQTSREERCFRLWINSLGIVTYVNNVFEDVRNGWVHFYQATNINAATYWPNYWLNILLAKLRQICVYFKELMELKSYIFHFGSIQSKLSIHKLDF